MLFACAARAGHQRMIGGGLEAMPMSPCEQSWMTVTVLSGGYGIHKGQVCIGVGAGMATLIPPGPVVRVPVVSALMPVSSCTDSGASMCETGGLGELGYSSPPAEAAGAPTDACGAAYEDSGVFGCTSSAPPPHDAVTVPDAAKITLHAIARPTVRRPSFTVVMARRIRLGFHAARGFELTAWPAPSRQPAPVSSP
jgi:hypothetical protein